MIPKTLRIAPITFITGLHFLHRYPYFTGSTTCFLVHQATNILAGHCSCRFQQVSKMMPSGFPVRHFLAQPLYPIRFNWVFSIRCLQLQLQFDCSNNIRNSCEVSLYCGNVKIVCYEVFSPHNGLIVSKSDRVILSS